MIQQPQGGNRFRSRQSEIIICSSILLICVVLVLVHRIAFFEPDEFCYYFSSINIIDGKWTLSQQELDDQRGRALKMSPLWPHDMGYIKFNNDYVLVKAPGYSVWLAFLRIIRLERLGNIILTIIGVATLVVFSIYRLPVGVSMVCVLLLLYTPINFTMMYRVFMSDYAAAAVLFIAGMLVLIRNTIDIRRKGIDYFLDWLAGFLLGAALVLRFTNGLTVIFLFFIHIFFALKPGLHTSNKRQWFVPIFLSIGFIIPIIGLLVYNVSIFGKFLATGYTLQPIRPQDTTFIFQQILRGYWINVYETILRNFTVLPEILVSGMPFLLLLPAALLWGYKNLERRMFIILSGWIISILMVYFQYRMLMPHIFVIISRMYLPLIGPSVILIGLYLHHLGRLYSKMVCIISVVSCLFFFAFFLSRIDVPFLGINHDGIMSPVQDVLGLFKPFTE